MTWDVIVIGSGFGGALSAYPLVKAGHRVLMMERGGWVSRGPNNWEDLGAAFASTHFNRETPYRIGARWRTIETGSVNCVGGQSVFYGGASFRFREQDFMPDPRIVADSAADWPFRYEALEQPYTQAEALLGIAGTAGIDPTEPFRSADFPQSPATSSACSRNIARAAGRLGLRPFPIPLAISYGARETRTGCIHCTTCDGFACATEAKNDIATSLIPSLMAGGMTLRTNAVCVRLLRTGSRITGVAYVDRVTGARGTLEADRVILAAGSLATPHLLLASRLDRDNPAGEMVGRYLTRHCNSVVFGLFPRRPNAERVFDKQIAIHDFYFGDRTAPVPGQPLGGLQQFTPPVGLVRAYLPSLLGGPAALFLSHAAGLLAITEDQPRFDNRVVIDESVRDRFGLPRLEIQHQYTRRDRAANAALVAHGRRILREAGAALTCVRPIDTYSHALGTVRMGEDERTAPLDAAGRFRGLDNLFIADGSALPRSAAVNPSLTIAANALRIGQRLAGVEHAAHAAVERPHRSLPIYAA